MTGFEEAKAPEPEDVHNDLVQLSGYVQEKEKRDKIREVIEKYPGTPKKEKNPSYWDKILEWLGKVKETLTADNIKYGLKAAGRKIIDGILKAVNSLVKLFKKEGKEAQEIDKPQKTVRSADQEKAAKKIQAAFRGSKKAVGKHSAAVAQQKRQSTTTHKPRKYSTYKDALLHNLGNSGTNRGK